MLDIISIGSQANVNAPLRALQGMSSASMRMILLSGIPSRFTVRYTDRVFATCR